MNISKKTGDLFFELWKKFDDKIFFESVELIKKRLKINKFKLSNFKDKLVCDVGCGSARSCYLAASEGAKMVVGIDSSKKNIDFNKKKFSKLKNVKFIVGDNVNLKLKSNSFDVTIGWGVIHHTIAMFGSLNELIRITKKNGKILLLIYGDNGLRWSLIKKLRPLAKTIGIRNIKKSMKKAKFKPNTIKNFIDDLFVPIQIQTSMKHIKAYLALKKIKKIKVWSKYKTFDHESSIDNYYSEFIKIKKIFSNLNNSSIKKISLKIINNYISEFKYIKNLKNLSHKVKRDNIIGEGNHRLEIKK